MNEKKVLKQLILITLCISLLVGNVLVFGDIDYHVYTAENAGKTHEVYGANQYATNFVYAKNRYWYLGVETGTADIRLYNSTDKINWYGKTLTTQSLYTTSGDHSYRCLQLAIDSNEDLHYVFLEHPTADIYYEKIILSTDGGIIQLGITKIEDGGCLNSFKVDGEDYPVLLYNNGAGYLKIMGSSTKDGTWTSDYKVEIQGSNWGYGGLVPFKNQESGSERDWIIIYNLAGDSYKTIRTAYFRDSSESMVGGYGNLDNLRHHIGIRVLANGLDVYSQDGHAYLVMISEKVGYNEHKIYAYRNILGASDSPHLNWEKKLIYSCPNTANDYAGDIIRENEYGDILVFYKHNDLNDGNMTFYYSKIEYVNLATEWENVWDIENFELFDISDTYQTQKEGHTHWNVLQSGNEKIISIAYAKNIHAPYSDQCVHVFHETFNFYVPTRLINVTLYNTDGTLNDGWIYQGEYYDLETYVLNASYVKLYFDDTENIINFIWENSTNKAYIQCNEKYVIGMINNEITRYLNDTVTKIRWRFTPDINIIDSYNVSLNVEVTNYFYDFTSYYETGIDLNIYNLGGITYYTFTGDAGRITGGRAFDLHAENGTNNSIARAEVIFRKLQHYHTLVEIDMGNFYNVDEFDFYNGFGYVEYGIEYRLNGSWVEGWSVLIYTQDANVGTHGIGVDHDWVEWSIDWYAYDPSLGYKINIDSDLIKSNFWGYDHEHGYEYTNRTSAQLFIDLWFDRNNASTTISGMVYPYYYGMFEQGNAFWFGYGNFRPITHYPHAKFHYDLYDGSGNITNNLDFDLIKVYCELGKLPSVGCDNDYWFLQHQETNRLIASDRMEGIDEPTIEETKVLDMPKGGLIAPLIKAINNLKTLVWSGLLGAIAVLWGAMDSIMELAGLGDWWRAFSMTLNSFSSFFIGIVDNLVISLTDALLLIEQIFLLISAGFGRFIGFISAFISGLLNWYNNIVLLFTGGLWGMGNIWLNFSLEDWVYLAINLSPIWWFYRISESDDKILTLKNDLEFVSSIITGMFNFFSSLIFLAIAVIDVIIGVLPI